jgi:DNA (cytosine-5)-methyltransferase 1
MNIIDLFSGAGGFSKAMQQAGYTIKTHYFSEIKQRAIDNFRYNFPDAIALGDITTINPQNLKDIDIITFGSPCQGLSSAGKNLGFSDPRSGLFLHAARLVAEIRPPVFVWENVKGLITRTHRKDFWKALQILAGIGDYTIECQLLDTRWVLPQHRERIYVIGRLRADRKPQIFPITESDCGTVERTAEAPTVRTLNAGGNSGGHHSGITLIINQAHGNFKGSISTDTVPALNVTNTKTNVAVCQITDYTRGKAQGDRVYHINGVSPTLRAANGGSLHTLIDLGDYDVRRLTPIECERLQGFPDNWTRYGINPKGKVYELSDTARYQLMGNAITVTMAQIIFQKIKNSL